MYASDFDSFSSIFNQFIPNPYWFSQVFASLKLYDIFLGRYKIGKNLDKKYKIWFMLFIFSCLKLSKRKDRKTYFLSLYLRLKSSMTQIVTSNTHKILQVYHIKWFISKDWYTTVHDQVDETNQKNMLACKSKFRI